MTSCNCNNLRNGPISKYSKHYGLGLQHVDFGKDTNIQSVISRMDGRKDAVSRGPGAEGGRSNQMAGRQTRGWRKGWVSLGLGGQVKDFVLSRSSGK